MSVLTKEQIISSVTLLSDLLKGRQYAIRGTANLVLQGYDMKVDDIDIVCDEGTALAVNTILKEYMVEPVKYSESSKFKSFFGKFQVKDTLVEVMGNWQIKNDKGYWSEAFDGSKYLELDDVGCKVHLTPVDLELKMFLYMGRWNAYHKIKSQYMAGNDKVSVDKVQPTLF